MADYKDRFKFEYEELTDRIEKLKNMLRKYKNGTLDFTPSCSYELLSQQLYVMTLYKNILIERAEIEGIEL